MIANGRATKLCSPDDVVNTIRLLIQPGGVTELRALDATTAADNWPATQSGYFNDPEKLAQAASRLHSAKGIYFIPNPVQDPLLARAANRLRKTPKGESTADGNIVCRRWLLIDCDPVRPSGISSTDAEHTAAIERAQQIDLYLHDRGWPDPVVADSGNGAHLLYHVDLPAADDGLVQRLLAKLAGEFDDETVKVDTSVFNPARIWKLYGTLTCKGDSTEDRPHRMSSITSSPESLQVVPRGLLEDLAGSAATASSRSAGASSGSTFDLPGFIARHLDVSAPAAWKGCGTIWNLETSPLCDHGGDGPFIGQQPDGAIVAGCHHDSCKGRWGWAELRARFEPKPESVHDGGDRWIRQNGAAVSTHSRETGELRKSVSVSAPKSSPNKPFPVGTLPVPVADFVSASAKAIGCDESFIGLPLLCCLARSVGNSRVIQIKPGWNEPAVLWGAIVAKSGSHKTPAMQQATKFLEVIQAKKITEHLAELEQYAIDKSVHEKNIAEWKRLRSNDPPPSEPVEPVCTRYITADATIEALVGLLAKQFDGLLVCRDELAGWLNFDEYKNGRGSGLGHWLSMWSASSMNVDRKTGQVRLLHIRRAAVSLIGGIQPGVLKGAIGREHMQDGLCARLLLAMPDPKPVVWTDEIVDWAVESRISQVFHALLTLEPAANDEGDFHPIPVPMTAEAKRVWIEYFNRHRGESAGLDDDLVAAWTKLEAYTARLALIIQLCRWAAGEADANAIDEFTMVNAIELSDWFGVEAKRVYGLFCESEKDSELRDLAAFVKRKGGVVTGRDLMRGSRKFTTAADADAALDSLRRAGYGTWIITPTATNQRREFHLSTSADTDTFE